MARGYLGVVLGKASTGAVLLALLVPTVASAATTQPLAPWDGSNPFNCVNQNVGTGTNFPDPDADPFCVEFDKTQQNVTDFGIADFLANEPARTAAAAPKCFYYQTDHWTGSIVQGSGPEIWHWDGHYFFDKAKGIGGVSVHNFRIGGQPADFTAFVPPAYQPYVYPGGGGGVIVTLETDPDPQCMAMVDTPAERARVYRADSGTPGCIPPGGRIHGRRVGRVKLNESRQKIRHALGDPKTSRHRVDRWCVIGAASLRVAYVGKKQHAGVVLTTAKGQTLHGVGPGMRARAARRKLGAHSSRRVGKTRVLEAMRTRRRVGLVGVRHGRVAWVGLGVPGHVHAALLRRAGVH